MERGVIAKRTEIELQRLAFEDRHLRGVVDHQMGEIGLAGDRTQRGEFGAGKANEVKQPRMRVWHGFEHRCVRRLREPGQTPKLGKGGLFGHWLISGEGGVCASAKAAAKSASAPSSIASRIAAIRSA